MCLFMSLASQKVYKVPYGQTVVDKNDKRMIRC